MKMKLTRVATGPDGTFGVLMLNSDPFALTLERPWNDNRRGESCIPAGEYTCLRCKNSPDYGYRNSPKFGDTFQVLNVPDRELILFHKGNLVDDTRGCIVVGEQFEPLNGQPGVLASSKGFDKLMSVTYGLESFGLNIVEAY